MQKYSVRGIVLLPVLISASLVYLLLFVQSSLASSSVQAALGGEKTAGQPGPSALLAAGIVVTPTDGLVTSEIGGQAVFHIFLTSRPSNPVRIGLQSMDTTEGALSVAEVTLTPGNWSTPVAVTITGVDDIYLDGNITYTIVTQPAQSSDPNYNNLDASDVTATNLDDDFGPVANNDLAATNEDSPVTIDILANDINYTPPVNVTIIAQPVHGSAALNPDNTVGYTPNPNYFGSDSFTYLFCDSTGNCDPADVNITITSVNDLPVAGNDAATLPEDSSVSVPVLSNDVDVDGDPLSILSLAQPSHGVATTSANHQIVYTPNNNFFGNDSLAYTIGDGYGGTDTATVALTITQVPDPPLAVGDVITTNEDITVNIPVLNNDSDPDGDIVSLQSFQAASAAGGVIVRDIRGTPLDLSDDWLTFSPAPGFYGSDSFSYIVSDGIFTGSASVAVTVLPSQPLPVANDDSYSTNDNTPLTVSAFNGVLANDSPGNGGTLTATLSSPPANGGISFQPDGSFTYTPSLNFSGSDSFQYVAHEGSYTSNIATVTIAVIQVNSRPAAANDTYATGLGQTLTVTVPGVLENDSDPDNDPLTAVLKSPPSRGQVALNPDGSFVYTPEASGSVGSDSFTYQAFDGLAYSANALVRIDLKDTKTPTVTWKSPVPNNGILYVENEIVRMEATAGDNVGIEKVIFFRWDAVKGIYVDIKIEKFAPYAFDFDTSVLNMGWNQIFARAYDTSGNASTFPFIFLYKVQDKSLFSIFLPYTGR